MGGRKDPGEEKEPLRQRLESSLWLRVGSTGALLGRVEYLEYP